MYFFGDRRVDIMLSRPNRPAFVVGPPVRLAILQQPSAAATSGVALPQQPIVVAVDVAGRVVTAAPIVITAAISTGTITGVVAVSTSGVGLAQYVGLALAGAPNTPIRTMSFTSPGLVGISSNPIVVSGAATSLELWLDASKPADITIATGISAWLDHNLSGRTVIQGTGVNQPALVAAAMNGLPVARFDGIVSYMQMAWPAGAQLNLGSTVFVVTAPRFVPDAIHNNPLVRWMPSNAAGTQEESTADPNVPSQGRLEAFTATNVGLKRASPAAIADQPPRVHSIVTKTTDISLYRNGVLVAGPTGGYVSITSSVGDLFRLCRADPGGADDQFGKYDLGEVLVYSRILTDTERQAVEQYLFQKWIPTTTSPGHGPIQAISSVIDGVTVNVQTSSAFAGPDFSSTEVYHHTIVVRFSSPLRKFAITQKATEFFNGAASGACVVACDDFTNYSGVVNWRDAKLFSQYVNTPGERLSVQYDAGFSCILLKDVIVNWATYGWLRSLWTDARFWLVGEPL